MNEITTAVFSKFLPSFDGLLAAADISADQIKRIEWGEGDVNAFIPHRDYFNGSLGVSELNEIVYVYRGTEWIALDIQRAESWGSNYAHEQSSTKEGRPVGDTLRPGDKFVVIDRYERDDWPGRELVNERSLIIWEIGSTLTEEDRLVQWTVEVLVNRDLTKFFTAASDVQREYNLSESAVRKACQNKRVCCWRLGRGWIIYRPDARGRWGR